MYCNADAIKAQVNIFPSSQDSNTIHFTFKYFFYLTQDFNKVCLLSSVDSKTVNDMDVTIIQTNLDFYHLCYIYIFVLSSVDSKTVNGTAVMVIVFIQSN